MKTMSLFFALITGLGAAAAQTPLANDAMVPPALRVRPAEPPATGKALRAQALAKLEAQFKKADADGDGQLSVEESKGFGFVARNFDAIDVERRGVVTFEDLLTFLARAKSHP